LISTYFYAKQADLADELLQKNPQVLDRYLNSETLVNLSNSHSLLECLSILEFADDPRVQPVRALLQSKFDSLSPHSQHKSGIYLAAAIWEMINAN